MYMARLGEMKQGAREGLDRDPDSDLMPTLPAQRPSAQCLAARRYFC